MAKNKKDNRRKVTKVIHKFYKIFNPDGEDVTEQNDFAPSYDFYIEEHNSPFLHYGNRLSLKKLAEIYQKIKEETNYDEELFFNFDIEDDYITHPRIEMCRLETEEEISQRMAKIQKMKEFAQKEKEKRKQLRQKKKEEKEKQIY